MTELLPHRFHARPDAPALIDPSETISYGALRDRVQRAATALAGRARVAILPRGDVDSLAVVLGAMTAGTGIVLLDRHLTAAPDELLGGLTSGTTGDPKLFVRDHASWATTLERSDATFDVRAGDRVATPGPLDHGHFFYGALTRGATVDLRPLPDAFAADDVTHAYLVPTLAVDLVALLGDSDMLFSGYLTADGLTGGPDAAGWASVGDLRAGGRRGPRRRRFAVASGGAGPPARPAATAQPSAAGVRGRHAAAQPARQAAPGRRRRRRAG